MIEKFLFINQLFMAILIKLIIILVNCSISTSLIFPNAKSINLINSKQLNVPTTCPCFKPKGSTECMNYDSRFQAATLNEAMFTFIDLGTNSPNPMPMFHPTSQAAGIQPLSSDSSRIHPNQNFRAPTQPAPIDNYSCTSRECQACKLKIIDGFIQSAGNDSQMRQLQQQMIESIGPTGGGGNLHCDYLERKNSNRAKSRCARCTDQANSNCPMCSGQESSTDDKVVDQMIQLLNSVQPNRKKRLSNNSVTDHPMLGISTTISCDYQRGEALMGDSPWCGLCNLCWTWRKLPSEYFPSYLNEVNCDQADNGCLADFGKCRPVYKSISVLRNLGTNTNPQWEQESISIVGACECQIEMGTPLYSFVIK